MAKAKEAPPAAAAEEKGKEHQAVPVWMDGQHDASGGCFVMDPATGKRVRVQEPPQEEVSDGSVQA